MNPARINKANYLAKVEMAGPDDCWIWTGAVVTNGYGTFTVANRTYNASHVALTLDGRERPDPPNHFALHGDCSNPRCVNPRHLRWGSQRENIGDVHRLARQAKNLPPPKLTDDDVRAIRTDPRTSPHVAKDYGVTPSQIRHIRRGVSRSDVK